MRSRDVKDVAASIHRRLQNLPDLQQDFQYTLIRYAAERLLYRLSQSPHRDRFVPRNTGRSILRLLVLECALPSCVSSASGLRTLSIP